MEKRDRDRRVQQTRDAIVGSFDGMVLAQPFGEIHVSDIVGAAGVGRSTFYEHFRNTDELLRHSVSKVLAAFADAATQGASARPMQCMIEHFAQNRHATKALLAGPSASQISRELADLIHLRFPPEYRTLRPPKTIPSDLAAVALAQMQLGFIRAWLEGVAPCSSAALADAILRTTRSAVAGLFAGSDCPSSV